MKPGLTLNSFNQNLADSDCNPNSIHCHLDRAAGHVISKDITISASNASANLNVFQLTGSVEIYRIYGVIKTATTLTNCTSAYFDLYTAHDGGSEVAITKNDGVLSGMAAGTFFTKEAVKTNTMTVINNATLLVTEPVTDKKQFTPFIITQKLTEDTYLRFNYTTTDAPANAEFTIYVEYRTTPDSGGTIVAV